MVDRKKVWIDIKNSHEPLFFRSLTAELPYEYFITARNYAEITQLLDRYGFKYMLSGSFHGKSMMSKAFYLALRSLELAVKVPAYDFLLSHGSVYAILANRIRRKKSITITDNDFTTAINRIIFEKSDHVIAPRYLETKEFSVKDLRLFDGFKEDIYVADFNPKECIEEIPMEEYVIVRPEAYKAYYIDGSEKTIVPEIISKLKGAGFKILLLPRYPEERERYSSEKGVFIPKKPVNGLCAIYRSRAVLTGSGTMGREAACMGMPSVSFFPGKKLLSVDREMINKGLLFHSRNPDDIVDFVKSSEKKGYDLTRSKKVKKEVVSEIMDIVER